MIISRFLRPSLLLALILVLSLPILPGCGLKGDLYLPESGPEETPESLLPDDEESSP
jgi:predicted small lipoprotein YifL